MRNSILFLLILCIFFLSCDKFKDNKKEISGKLIYVMFDLSGSTKKPDIRESYSRNLKTIMKSVSPGDVIIAGLITQKSISELSFCIQYEFPEFKASTDNPLYKKAEAKKYLKKINIIKDSLLEVADSTIKNLKKIVLRTEIIGALQVAERVCNSYSQAKNVLVIMSDMYEDSKLYRFKNENLSSKRIKSILNYENKSGRIPNLKEVKVYVVGAISRDTKKFLQIRTFWQEYFKVCGANLASENYGSNLIRFKE